MTRKSFFILGIAGGTLYLAGCNQKPAQPRTADLQSPTATDAHAARPKVATFSDYPVPPKPEVTADFVNRGKLVYEQNCAACHGVKGDGKSDAAAFLLPKPRNFQEAKYRLRSTPSGSLPTDPDLYRAVSLGMPGTPMPPWQHMLTETDRWAVVEYIKTFSARFAESSEARNASLDLGAPPARNTASISEGKELYAKMSCVTCHGETGLGNGTSAATLVDDSGQRAKPRDFSKPGSFKSGYSTKEIVRSILTGFDGTPMLGFHGTVKSDEAWKIAYFIESFAKSTPASVVRASQNFLVREELGEPNVRIKLTERAWQFDPAVIRVKKDQIVEITFEPTDNGLGVGHGFAISSYDEVAFINGAMVGVPKVAKFRADRAGKFTFYCSTQCSTDKLHPLMNGTLIVEDTIKTAALE